MAIVQAFASNVFNVCMALGAVWLVQASAGTCDYGGGQSGWCGGCYLPGGVTDLPCPGSAPAASGVAEAGSLEGTILFTVVCVLCIVATLAWNGGSIPAGPALGYLGLYALYALYQVLAAEEYVPALCVGGVCI